MPQKMEEYQLPLLVLYLSRKQRIHTGEKSPVIPGPLLVERNDSISHNPLATKCKISCSSKLLTRLFKTNARIAHGEKVPVLAEKIRSYILSRLVVILTFL